MRSELSSHPFLTLRATDERIALDTCVVPPLVADSAVGEAFRRLLPEEAAHHGRRFPDQSLCGAELARIAVDHGALALPATDAAEVLASGDLTSVTLEEHERRGGLLVDPVLRVLEALGRESTRSTRMASRSP